ncbi:MAG: hypothetical protein K6E47_05155 [Lachnospiraceae bacterium]|nr:hypothetical protein [Lachnospiraceae bacterium]
MIEYFTYYASSNIVGIIIFGIMLAHDCLGVDAGVFPVNRFTVLGTNFANAFR